MARQVVTVFGGSGFVGRYLVQRLADAGWIIRVAVRDPYAAAFLKPLGDVGQIVPWGCDVGDDAAVTKAVDGADAVINLVGILYESGRRTFERVHVEAPRRIATAAKAAGVARLIQMSALGADPESKAEYARTKAGGEAAVREILPAASIVRPSVIFGPEDEFLNRFARMARILPVLPVFDTSFQPVYVGDVAEAMVRILDNDATQGKTYELGGPRVVTFEEMMKLLLETIGRKRLLVPMPFAVAQVQASVLQLLPVPPLTRDQVELLKTPNVVSERALTLKDLDVVPTAMDLVIPSYLYRYRPPSKQKGQPPTL